MLPLYEGAVRGTLRLLYSRQQRRPVAALPPVSPAPAGQGFPASRPDVESFGPAAALIPPGAHVVRTNDARAAAAMTQNNLGAPSVAYKGG